MKAVIQRVSRASVTVDGELVSEIKKYNSNIQKPFDVKKTYLNVTNKLIQYKFDLKKVSIRRHFCNIKHK